MKFVKDMILIFVINKHIPQFHLKLTIMGSIFILKSVDSIMKCPWTQDHLTYSLKVKKHQVIPKEDMLVHKTIKTNQQSILDI
jgi:hypothetical protein